MEQCVCICGGSAVEFWRIWRLLGTRGLRGLGISASRDFIRSHRDAVVGGNPSDFGMPDLCTFEGLTAGQVAFLSTPVEFLVTREGEEVGWDSTQAYAEHVSSGWAAGRVVRVSGRVCVTAPTPSLAWVAQRHGVIEMLRLLYEFCGRYAVDPGYPEGFKGVVPLVTWSELYGLAEGGPAEETADACGHGTALLRRLLSYVAEGCASPMQAAAVALLCLPPSMGGAGLPLPEANRPVLPADRVVPLAEGRPYMADAVWEWAKTVVEFDSRARRPAVVPVRRPNARRLALEAHGYRVVGVSMAELADTGLFLRAVLNLAGCLGVRMVPERLGAGWVARHELLKKELLCGLGAWRGEGPLDSARIEHATVRAGGSTAEKRRTSPPMVRAMF